jgi:hypothetical protein
MDDAARRVKPRNLDMAVRLREKREQRALMELKAALADRDAAEDACTLSSQELSTRQELRRTGETQAYHGLAQAGPLPVDALGRHLAAIESLTDDVQSASQRLDEAEVRKERAEEAASQARSVYARHAHQARKWAQLSAKVTNSRRALMERAAELEVEEEGSSRTGQAHVLRSVEES